MKRLLSALLFLLPLGSAAHATLIFVPIDITVGTGSSATHSTGFNGDSFPANNALNGNTGDFTHTSVGDPNPAWTGNLGRDESFNTILVHNRDNCCGERLSDITVSVLDSSNASVFNSGLLNANNILNSPAFLTVNTGGAITGRSIIVARDGASTVGAGTGGMGVLALGEVQIGNLLDAVIPLGTNLTQAGIVNLSVAQSPTSGSPPGGGFAGNAIDGNFGNFTHTDANVNLNHMWQINFGEEMLLESVSMFNRTSCCGERLRDITVTVLDGMGGTIFTSALLNPGNALGYNGVNQGGLAVDFAALNGGSPIVGQTVVITRSPSATGGGPDDQSVLSLGEVQVFGGTIPEPSSALFLGLSALVLSIRRRRR